MRSRARPAHRAARGMSLLEVLVAIVIFSVGLIGLVGLQARAVSFSSGAEDTNRAALLANEIAAEMLMSQSVSLSTAKLDTWKQRVEDVATSGLPNGVGDVRDVGAGTVEISIRWRSPKAASGAANSENRYITHVKVVT